MEQIRYQLILQNIIFCTLKSLIFFDKQAFTLSLKRVSFFNSESNTSADLWRHKSQKG